MSETRAPAVIVEDLRIEVTATGDDIVDLISYEIAPGEVLGLVGESGSGKTTAGLALLGHTRRGATITRGSVHVGEFDILGMDEDKRRDMRGRVVSYVPQDPAAALNPALRIGTQLRETLEAHHYGSNDGERTARVAEMMREVALPDDKKYLRRYPHELSGGQQQRVGLAMAFACRPRLIVLDEPTTGLDVTTQAHVLATVRELADAHGTAALYVSHDLAVVATLATRVAVMYAGRIVELGQTESLFHGAAHPYTRRLIAAIPHLSGRRALVGIPGRAPSPGKRPNGCAFAPRCTLVEPACEAEMPALRIVEPDHGARCIKAEQVLAQSVALAGDAEPRIEVTEIGRRGAEARGRERELRPDRRGARHQPRDRPPRVPRARGRVRFGQDHAGPLDLGPAQAARRPDPAARNAARAGRPIALP